MLFRLGQLFSIFHSIPKMDDQYYFPWKDDEILSNYTIKLSLYPIACPHFPLPHLYSGYIPLPQMLFKSHLSSRPHSSAHSSMKPPPHQKSFYPLLYSHSTSWVPLLWFLPLPALSFSDVLTHLFSSTRLSSLVEDSLC